MIHRFSVDVNCDLSGKEPKLYPDHGFIMLPEQYSEHGTPTRLVISCHGAGGTVNTDDSQIEHQVLTRYLVANGYAVMDVGGLPIRYAEERGIDIRNNIGSPIATACYVAAYQYCQQHFHLKPEVFLHGASMGGISSTNLLLNGSIPIIAHSAFCPVLDTYGEIFLHPWSGGAPRVALGKIYGLDTDAHGAYIYDEQKLMGCNPMQNPKALQYPVPVKFWHCEDDGTVSCEITRAFVERIRANGGAAELRTFPHGGHEPQMVGDPIAVPSGKSDYQGNRLPITPAVEEVFEWIRKHDLS